MNRIRELRDEKHFSQTRLSIELGVSQETISAYETGKNYPSARSLIKLHKLFNASTDYILGLSDMRSIPIQRNDLCPDESALIQMYRKLDAEGRSTLMGFAKGYTSSKKSDTD